ncbi:PseD protein, partial [Campylobacter jejuni]
TYLNIEKEYLLLTDLNLEESKKNIIINNLMQQIDNFKEKLEDEKNIYDIKQILGPFLIQFELNLARIYVLNPKTPEDSFNK